MELTIKQIVEQIELLSKELKARIETSVDASLLAQNPGLQAAVLTPPIKLWFDGNKVPGTKGTTCSFRLEIPGKGIAGKVWGASQVIEQTITLPLTYTIAAAEYSGLLVGLDRALSIPNLRKCTIEVSGDNKQVIDQINAECECKVAHLRKLRSQVRTRLEKFDLWSITWTPREKNKAG